MYCRKGTTHFRPEQQFPQNLQPSLTKKQGMRLVNNNTFPNFSAKMRSTTHDFHVFHSQCSHLEYLISAILKLMMRDFL